MMRSTTLFLSPFESSTCPGLVFFLFFSQGGAHGFAVIPLPITKAVKKFYAFSTLSVFIGFELAILFCWLEKNCSSTLHFVILFPFALPVLT
jgi:hypothetical protein